MPRRARIVAFVLAIGAFVLGFAIFDEDASIPQTTTQELQPGESLTVNCPTELTGTIEPTQAQLDCASEPTPEPTPTPTQPPVACTGTQVPPGANLHQVVGGKGGRFCLAAGTYNLGSTPLKPGAGAALIGVEGSTGPNGEITAPTKIVGSASLAVIQGSSNQSFTWLDISGSNPGGACQPDCGRGIKPGAGTTIDHVRVHDNSNQGISSSQNFTVTHSEIDNNGREEFKGTYGGIKAAASNASAVLTVTNSYVHGNLGNGIWGDRCQHRFIATDNLVVGNSRDGIKHETNMVPSGCSNTTTRSASILRNTLRNNGGTGDAGIKIRNSPNADVGFNITSGNPTGILVIYNGTKGSNIGNRIHDNQSPDGIRGCEIATCTNNN